jgi:cytochrome P450
MALLRRLHGVSKHGNYAKVELRSMLLDLTSNIIMRMVAGKRYYGEDVKEIEEARIFKEIMEEFAECIAVRNLGDMIPLLQWIDFTGHLKKLDRLSKKMDVFLQGLVDEHRDDRDRNTMINRFLALQEEQPEYYTDEVIKGHVLVSQIKLFLMLSQKFVRKHMMFLFVFLCDSLTFLLVSSPLSIS